MTNDHLIYGENIYAFGVMHFLIAGTLPHIWLCTRSHLNFPIYEEHCVFLFYQCNVSGLPAGIPVASVPSIAGVPAIVGVPAVANDPAISSNPGVTFLSFLIFLHY
jgi:hypothetical protein